MFSSGIYVRHMSHEQVIFRVCVRARNSSIGKCQNKMKKICIGSIDQCLVPKIFNFQSTNFVNSNVNKQTITDHHIGSEYSPLRTLLTLAFGKQVSLQFISCSARVLAKFAIELIRSLWCFFRIPARMQE